MLKKRIKDNDRYFFVRLFLGFLLFSLGLIWVFIQNHTPLNEIEHFPSERTNRYGISFQNSNYLSILFFVFKNNLIAGLKLAFVGLLTGGAGTVLILIYNGYILGLVLHDAHIVQAGILNVARYLLHAPFELMAIFLFSAMGFKGIFIIEKLLSNKIISGNDFPKPKEFFIPTILLFIGACIEALIIYKI